jgi:O-antigen/teichoic acid export membrane protein
MLGALTNAKTVGLYKVAVTLAGLVTIILGAANSALAPIIVKINEGNNRAELQKIVAYSALLTSLIVAPLFVGFFFFGSYIIQMLYGAEYIAGSEALAVLSAFHLFNVLVGSVAIILNMLGHESYVLRGQVVALLINVILNAWFIPKWGLAGAAWATGLGMAAYNIILAYYVGKRTQLIPGVAGIFGIWRENIQKGIA